MFGLQLVGKLFPTAAISVHDTDLVMVDLLINLAGKDNMTLGLIADRRGGRFGCFFLFFSGHIFRLPCVFDHRHLYRFQFQKSHPVSGHHAHQVRVN